MLPEAVQQSLVSCIAENNLTRFKVIGIDLPREFSKLLPSSIDALLVGSDIDPDPTFVEKHLTVRKVAASARPTQIRIPTPQIWLRNERAWFLELEQAFLDKCLHLDFSISHYAALIDVVSRISKTLKTLTLRFCGYPKRREFYPISGSWPRISPRV